MLYYRVSQREEGMGDKGEDVEQMTTGRIQPSSPVLYPAEPLGRVHTMK